MAYGTDIHQASLTSRPDLEAPYPVVIMERVTGKVQGDSSLLFSVALSLL